MSYFGGRKDPKIATREAIVTLRQQLQMLEKKEDYLLKKIDEELKKAKANAISNKPGKSLRAGLVSGVCGKGLSQLDQPLRDYQSLAPPTAPSVCYSEYAIAEPAPRSLLPPFKLQ